MQKEGFLKALNIFQTFHPHKHSSTLQVYIQKHICLLDNDMLNRMYVMLSTDSYSAFDAAARSF